MRSLRVRVFVLLGREFRVRFARIFLGVVFATLAAFLLKTTNAAALTPGTQALVQTDDGTCLNMRVQPSLEGTIVTCVPDGSIVDVQAGSVPAEGFEWQRIGYGAQSGWSVDAYLQPLAASPAPTSGASATATEVSTALPSPALSGAIPPNGGFGLAVWSGGLIDDIAPLAAQGGCSLRAVWVTVAGDFVGYIFGAPAVANASWTAAYPGNSLPPSTAIILVCAASGVSARPALSVTPSPAVAGATPGLPPGVPSEPPGPAGNG